MGIFGIGFFQSVIRLTIPVLLASLGCMFTARSGIINFAMEGIMLVGAFCGYYGAYITGSPIAGCLFAMMGGVGIAMILGFTSIHGGVDQVVAGTGINILCAGLTSYLLSSVFGAGQKPSQIQSLEAFPLPFLSKIPFFGEILFHQNLLVYVTYFLVPLCWYVIYKTPYGMNLRAVGESPATLESVGGHVQRTRYSAILLSGVFGGLGGACLSIANLSVFMENMVAGRGYLAWSTVTVGKWNPLGITGAAFLFGGADALQMRLQAYGINFPWQFLMMFPYVLTMLVLAGIVGKTVGPASMGKPYNREAR